MEVAPLGAALRAASFAANRPASQRAMSGVISFNEVLVSGSERALCCKRNLVWKSCNSSGQSMRRVNLCRYVSLLLVPRWVTRRYMRGKWTTSVPMLRAYGKGITFMIAIGKNCNVAMTG